MWVRVALSCVASESPPADTVTICAVSQFDVVNVRLLLLSDRSVPDVPPIDTVTSAVGSVASFTV